MQDIYESYRNSVLHTIALMVPLIVLVGILLYFAFRAPRYYVYLPNGLYFKFLLGGKLYPYERYDITQGGLTLRSKVLSAFLVLEDTLVTLVFSSYLALDEFVGFISLIRMET